jgi:putative flavoprotein involved in K+ transport
VNGGADVDVLVVGGGHGGLTVAAHLRRARRDVLVVDAGGRVGDSWRNRYDSLRLFTPRPLNGLPASTFPPGDDPFPVKDEIADYHEEYAGAMSVPLRLGHRVSSLRGIGRLFEAAVGPLHVRARAVVVATSVFGAGKIPPFAADIDPSVRQLHSSAYRRPSDLPDGPVVVVGARNSGADIAVEVARHRPTTIAMGTPLPRAPARWRSPLWWRIPPWRDRFIGELALPVPWPFRPGGFLVVDLDEAAAAHGLRLAARAVGAEGDQIKFADGSATRARTVIWASGYTPDHTWIDGPKIDGNVAIGRRGRTAVGRLWIVRGRFLFSVGRHAHEVARDVIATR